MLTGYMRGSRLPVVRLHGTQGERAERKGIAWIAGGFFICPCHSSLTLWVATTLLSGTAAGAFVVGHEFVVGAALTFDVARRHWISRSPAFILVRMPGPRIPKQYDVVQKERNTSA